MLRTQMSCRLQLNTGSLTCGCVPGRCRTTYCLGGAQLQRSPFGSMGMSSELLFEPCLLCFASGGNTQLVQHQTYTYRLSTGYPCMLTGWTHTRTYARGFLRAVTGTATATVKDLEPGGFYVWRIYQFASILSPCRISKMAGAVSILQHCCTGRF